jgi:transcription elongation factor Elf1
MTHQPPVPVICMNCGHHEVLAVHQVTASLMCTCGSDDLDLYVGSPEQVRLAAGPKEYNDDVAVPTHQAPPTIEGWNEYQGPMPGRNTQSNGIPTPIVCPVCHGSGMDPEGYEGGGNGGKCRECGDSGVYTPMTSATPPMVARHPYPSTQTQVPFMGSPGVTATVSGPMAVDYQLKHTDPQYSADGPRGPRNKEKPFSPTDSETWYPKAPERSRAINYRKPHDYSQETAKPFVMPGSSCPNCGHDPLSLTKDHKDDAWASCPNCGPLVNIDKHPEFDPYSLRFGDELPKEKFKQSSRRLLGSVQKSGRLMSIIASVRQSNPGLTVREVVWLARRTVERY